MDQIILAPQNLDPERERVLFSASTQVRDPQVDPCDTPCPYRMTCERGAYSIDPADPNCRSFLLEEDGHCASKIMRRSVVEAAQNLRGHGKKHNSHAQRHKSHAQRARELGLAPPDLKVSRHIRDGRDIKK